MQQQKKKKKSTSIKNRNKSKVASNKITSKKHSFWKDLNKNWMQLPPIAKDLIVKGFWELIKTIAYKIYVFLYILFLDQSS